MIKVTVELPNGDGEVRQREFKCESYFLKEGCLVMRLGQALPGGWYFAEIGMPLSRVEAWFVGEGSAHKSIAQAERADLK